jgi:phage gpG-like protein
MIKAVLVNAEGVVVRLQKLPEQLRGAVRRAVEAETIALARHVKEFKLTGQQLKTRTGTLRRSIAAATLLTGPDAVLGAVGTNLVYAATHEYGGTTRAHVIEARRKKALAFAMGGKDVVVRRVMHPGSRMPERSFLRSSLAERADDIRAALERAVAQAVQA